MMLVWVTYAALVCCTGVAVLVARRRPDHRPFAAFFGVVTLANLVRAGLTIVAPIRPLGSEPFTGVARVVFHIEEALFLTWPAGLAALVVMLFVTPRWTAALPGVTWAGVVAYLVTHYPAIRGQALGEVYLLAELAALTVASGVMIAWTWRRASPAPAHLCTLLVVLVDWVALMGGSLRWGLWDHYYLDQIVFLLMYVTLIVYQVPSWRPRSSSQ
jgi:hypothetical protein